MRGVEHGLGHDGQSGFDAHLLYVAACGVKYIIASQAAVVGQFEK
jgi:hypothetical protein